MSMKKTMLTVAAVSALTAATAVPASALENEFHGMYRFMGYLSNAETGGVGFNLKDDAKNSFFAEQRARILYTAKANDDLKLVTHFELDSRFGGSRGTTARFNNSNGVGGTTINTSKYQTNDAGSLDADQVTLETKNFYLDFNVPSTPVNMKVGLQPFNDAYQGVFGAFDGTGIVASAKMGAITPTVGWFRFSDNDYIGGSGTLPGDDTLDMFLLDGKFAVNKDVTVGASYYILTNDQNATLAPANATTPGSTSTPVAVNYEFLNMLGVNASAKVGPAALTGFLAYQFGDFTGGRDLSAWAASAIAKVAAGPGKVNASVLYLSGDDRDPNGDFKGFQQLQSSGSVSYFNPSNMWLLIRNGAMINSSAAVSGNDLTTGGAGLLGVFAGYEMAAGKAFGSANLGYAQAAKKGAADSRSIGTEVNATVGYKVYDNLTASFTAAYLFIGDGMGGDAGDTLLPKGVTNADNPYLTNIQLSYVF